MDMQMTTQPKMYYVRSTNGFYNFPVYPYPDAVEVSIETYEYIRSKIKDGYKIGIDEQGQPIVKDRPEPEPLVEDIDTVFSTRLSELNQAYEQVCLNIRGTYPGTETDTWTMQLYEAQLMRKWIDLGSVSADRPILVLLDTLSNERDLLNVGDGLEDLVDRILANAYVYNNAVAKATAIRHSAEQTMTIFKMSDDLEGLKSYIYGFAPVYEFLQNL